MFGCCVKNKRSLIQTKKNDEDQAGPWGTPALIESNLNVLKTALKGLT